MLAERLEESRKREKQLSTQVAEMKTKEDASVRNIAKKVGAEHVNCNLF